MWAYNGWHGITPVAEEVRNPERNIPRAMFGGVGVLIVLYVSANIAYHGVLSMEEMAAAGPHAAETMVAALLGPFGAAAMAAVIMCSTFGGINSNLLLSTRIPFALGRDRLLAPVLGKVQRRLPDTLRRHHRAGRYGGASGDRLRSAHRGSGAGRERRPSSRSSPTSSSSPTASSTSWPRPRSSSCVASTPAGAGPIGPGDIPWCRCSTSVSISGS